MHPLGRYFYSHINGADFSSTRVNHLLWSVFLIYFVLKCVTASTLALSPNWLATCSCGGSSWIQQSISWTNPLLIANTSYFLKLMVIYGARVLPSIWAMLRSGEVKCRESLSMFVLYRLNFSLKLRMFILKSLIKWQILKLFQLWPSISPIF